MKCQNLKAPWRSELGDSDLHSPNRSNYWWRLLSPRQQAPPDIDRVNRVDDVRDTNDARHGGSRVSVIGNNPNDRQNRRQQRNSRGDVGQRAVVFITRCNRQKSC